MSRAYNSGVIYIPLGGGIQLSDHDCTKLDRIAEKGGYRTCREWQGTRMYLSWSPIATERSGIDLKSLFPFPSDFSVHPNLAYKTVTFFKEYEHPINLRFCHLSGISQPSVGIEELAQRYLAFLEKHNTAPRGRLNSESLVRIQHRRDVLRDHLGHLGDRLREGPFNFIRAVLGVWYAEAMRSLRDESAEYAQDALLIQHHADLVWTYVVTGLPIDELEKRLLHQWEDEKRPFGPAALRRAQRPPLIEAIRHRDRILQEARPMAEELMFCEEIIDADLRDADVPSYGLGQLLETDTDGSRRGRHQGNKAWVQRRFSEHYGNGSISRSKAYSKVQDDYLDIFDMSISDRTIRRFLDQ